jgi:hypothetical protein
MGAGGSHAGDAAASSVGLDEVRAATAVGLDVDCDAVLGRAVPPVPGLEQARAVRAGALLILTRSKFGKYLSKGWRAAAGTSLSLIIELDLVPAFRPGRRRSQPRRPCASPGISKAAAISSSSIRAPVIFTFGGGCAVPAAHSGCQSKR